jgi:hypothetical protein
MSQEGKRGGLLRWLLVSQLCFDSATIICAAGLLAIAGFLLSVAHGGGEAVWFAIPGLLALTVGVIALVAGVATVVVNRMFLRKLRRGGQPRSGFVAYQAVRAAGSLYLLAAYPAVALLFLGSVLALPALGALLLPARQRVHWLVAPAALLLISPVLLAGTRLVYQANLAQAQVAANCTPGGPAVDLTISGAVAGHVGQLCGRYVNSPTGANACSVQNRGGSLAGANANLAFRLNGTLYELSISAQPPYHGTRPAPGYSLPLDIADVTAPDSSLQPTGSPMLLAVDDTGGQQTAGWEQAQSGSLVFAGPDHGTVDATMASNTASSTVTIRGTWRCASVTTFP